jgi:hypothetical protein
VVLIDQKARISARAQVARTPLAVTDEGGL